MLGLILANKLDLLSHLRCIFDVPWWLVVREELLAGTMLRKLFHFLYLDFGHNLVDVSRFSK